MASENATCGQWDMWQKDLFVPEVDDYVNQ